MFDFLLSQIGFDYMKLGSRNLRFWTSAKNMILIRKTPAVGGLNRGGGRRLLLG